MFFFIIVGFFILGRILIFEVFMILGLYLFFIIIVWFNVLFCCVYVIDRGKKVNIMDN